MELKHWLVTKLREHEKKMYKTDHAVNNRCWSDRAIIYRLVKAFVVSEIGQTKAWPVENPEYVFLCHGLVIKASSELHYRTMEDVHASGKCDKIPLGKPSPK